MNKMTETLQINMSGQGFKSAVVPISHLKDLKNDLGFILKQDMMTDAFYDDQLSHLKFSPPVDFTSAKSIILTAVQQPKLTVTFHYQGRTIQSYVPPSYCHKTDEMALELLARYLNENGHRVHMAAIPEKSLAVHCGLATYGKNNVTYIDDWGSFFRLRAFISDMPSKLDQWNEFTIMDICHRCQACQKSCPTGAISEDRFLIHHNRCLTYMNERTDPFPDWIDPNCHNCFIGCMECQDHCPLNKTFKNKTSEGEVFSEEETMMILSGCRRNQLSEEIQIKLKRLWLWEDYPALEKNLRMILK